MNETSILIARAFVLVSSTALCWVTVINFHEASQSSIDKSLFWIIAGLTIIVVTGAIVLNLPLLRIVKWKSSQAKCEAARIADIDYPLVGRNLQLALEAREILVVPSGSSASTVCFPRARIEKNASGTWEIFPGRRVVVSQDGLVSRVRAVVFEEIVE